MTNSENKTSRQFEDIEMILRDLLKVFKVVALYPEDNPLPESLRRTFSERLVDLVNNYGELDFGINQDKILYQSEVAFTDHSREEALAGLFFETGIIRITFKPGLEVEEVYRLLDAVKTYQNGDRLTSDLAANLWEAGLQHFAFETVEDIALRQYDGDSLLQVLEEAEDGNYQQMAYDKAADYQDIFTEAGSTDPLASDSGGFENSFLADTDKSIDISQMHAGPILSTGDADIDAGLQVSEAVEAMGFGDLTGTAPSTLPDTQLIVNDELKLSEEEQKQVDKLVRRDAEFVEYESLCELMKEILHQEAEMTDFYESVTIGERVLVEFVKQGKLIYAAELLRYFVKLEEQLRSDRPLWAERLKDARVTTGSRERLAILCEALNENAETGSLELRSYLDNFDWDQTSPRHGHRLPHPARQGPGTNRRPRYNRQAACGSGGFGNHPGSNLIRRGAASTHQRYRPSGARGPARNGLCVGRLSQRRKSSASQASGE